MSRNDVSTKNAERAGDARPSDSDPEDVLIDRMALTLAAIARHLHAHERRKPDDDGTVPGA